MLPRLLRISSLLLLAFLAVSGVRTIYRNNSQNITLSPLQLDPAHPGERRLGDLIFLKAWELRSNNGKFGGISAFTALPDERFVGVSDVGTLVGFGIGNDETAVRSFITPLPGAFGADAGYKDRDSEGMTQDAATGRTWISYESNHMIRRFDPSFTAVEASAKPPLMANWPSNGGAESIVRLPDGRFVVFSERDNRGDGIYAAILFSGDPVEPRTIAAEFRYKPPAGYKPTDAAMLPDGRMLMLHRRIALPSALFAAKLTIIEPSNIRGGALISGKVIATLAAPLLVDNMEGLAVTREGNDNIIWLISDNNFNILQRTLLMKFRLAERRAQEKTGSGGRSRF